MIKLSEFSGMTSIIFIMFSSRSFIIPKSCKFFLNSFASLKPNFVKFKTNPDLVIDIFGADHHGHAPRLKAAVAHSPTPSTVRIAASSKGEQKKALAA